MLTEDQMKPFAATKMPKESKLLSRIWGPNTKLSKIRHEI